MRHGNSTLFVMLAVCCLLFLATVSTRGYLLKSAQQDASNSLSAVLGQMIQKKEQGNTDLNSSLEQTKHVLSQKAEETKNTILASVEKEAKDMTQAQIHNLQTQICKQWGVLEPSPTQTVTPTPE